MSSKNILVSAHHRMMQASPIQHSRQVGGIHSWIQTIQSAVHVCGCTALGCIQQRSTQPGASDQLKYDACFKS